MFWDGGTFVGKKGDAKASSLGERGIIDMIWSELKVRSAAPPESPLPHPDDAAAVPLDDGTFLVLKTDMFVRRTDAPKGMRYRAMGWKAITMAVSDMAAKGAKPLAAMVALGVPRGCSASSIRLFFRGISDASRHYGCPVLGGDVGEARDLCASVFIAGSAKKPVARSGAKPGDILAVTGEFGSTGAAYKMLLEGLPAPPSVRRQLRRSVFAPKARLNVGLSLAGSGLSSSSMDSSDGMAFTLHSLSRSSGCGFEVANLPISRSALEFARIHSLNPDDLAFFGGEEYELVLTVPPEHWGDAVAAAEKAGGRLIQIGAAVPGHGVKLLSGGASRAIPERGYEHLR